MTYKSFVNKVEVNIVSNDLQIIPKQSGSEFVVECNSISKDSTVNHETSQGDLPDLINSTYLHVPLFKQIESGPVSSIGIIHTNILLI